jgi:hypothetical protein
VGWILGELWEYVPHAEWDELHFGSLGESGVQRLLELAEELRERGRQATEVLEDAEELVRSAA